MTASRLPATGAHRRGWLRPPPDTTNDAIAALARAADELCAAALVQEAILARSIPGALDDRLKAAAAAYRAAAAAMDRELEGERPSFAKAPAFAKPASAGEGRSEDEPCPTA